MSASIIIHELARYVAHLGEELDVTYSEISKTAGSGGPAFGAWVRSYDVPFDTIASAHVYELIVDCTDGADCTPKILVGDTNDDGTAPSIPWEFDQIARAFEAAGYTPTDAWTEMMSKLEDAYQELTPAPEPCEDRQWDLLDALLDRAENGGPCWYIDGKLVIERGESAPYVMYYGGDGMFHGTFQVAHFYAKALRVFGPTQAPRATLREFGVKVVQ